jgi:hypothetical protein
VDLTDNEINRRIAEHLGWKRGLLNDQIWHSPECDRPRVDMTCCACCFPDFLTDPAMLPLMLERILGISAMAVHIMSRDARYHLNLFRGDAPTLSGRDGGQLFVDENLQRAVCLAYLRAFGLEEK